VKSALHNDNWTRKITRAEFACLRARLDGLDDRTIGELYLSPDEDLRAVRATIEFVAERVRRLAYRNDKPAGLLRLMRTKLPKSPGEQTDTNTGKPTDNSAGAQGAPAATPKPRMTLEEFRLKVDPGNVYRESELIELYADEHGEDDGKAKHIERLTRLRNRQLEVLRWAEAQVTSTPMEGDPIAMWMPDYISRRLQKSGFKYFYELVPFINARGARWFVEIPKFGKGGAGRVMNFLALYHTELGLPLTTKALVPARSMTAAEWKETRSKAYGIVPIEYFQCPDVFDGSNGINRARGQCQLAAANNDLEAITVWLSAYAASPNTFRAYRKEAERLLLWAIVERGKPFSSLLMEDTIAYRDFLGSKKTAKWAGKRGEERHSANWRPFEARPLAFKSIEAALRICSSLCTFLAGVNYLGGNPFLSVATKSKANTEDAREAKKQDYKSASIQDRALPIDLWQTITDKLDAIEEDEAGIRLKLILMLGADFGLRAMEIGEAKLSDFVWRTDRTTMERYRCLLVAGKGAKVREIPVPASIPLVDLLGRHLVARGLNSEIDDNDPATRVVGRIELSEGAPTELRSSGLSYERIYKIVTTFFKDSAINAGLSKDDKSRLNKASTHWLRHTFGTHNVQSGMPLEMIADLMGHTDLTTTKLYANTSKDDARRKMDAIKREGAR
jgi:integrase